MDPYRNNEIVNLPAGPQCGLIRQAPAHICKLPSVLWARLTLRPITHGSLYRCPNCLVVYKYKCIVYSESRGYWQRDHVSAWIQAGGEE